MMNEDITVTVVRASLHESSHSHRRQQLQRALEILRDQLHVHGLVISQGLLGIDVQAEGHFETLGDILRRLPDPRLVIEFFDEPVVAGRAKDILREAFPEARVLWWSAQCPATALRPIRPRATHASGTVAPEMVDAGIQRRAEIPVDQQP